MAFFLVHFPFSELPRLTHFGYTTATEAKNHLDLHRHFGFELKFFTEGKMSFRMRPELAPTTATAGDLLLTHPEFEHQFEILERGAAYYWMGFQLAPRVAKSRTSHFNSAAFKNKKHPETSYLEQVHYDLEELSWSMPREGFEVLRGFAEAHRLFLDIEEEIRACRRHARHIVSLRIVELFTLLARRFEEGGENKRTAPMERVEAYLRKNFEKPLRLREVAEMFRLQPGSLSRAFRNKFSQSPIDFVTSLRLDKARLLLSQGMSVEKTAVACGFADAFYFSSVFKEAEGMPPSKYGKRK